MQKAKQNKGEFMEIMDMIGWLLAVVVIFMMFGTASVIIIPAVIGGVFLLKRYGV